MKRFALLLFVCAGLFASCKKSGGGDVITPVDPRDRMVGAYAVGYNIRITFAGKELNPESNSGTVTVSKNTQQASQLYIDFDFPGTKERVTAELSGNNFTVVDKKTEAIILNGTTFTGQYSATGQITTNSEFIYTGVSEDSGLKKTTTVTGTKK
ncbi:hypothetical protein ACAW74_23470 [Fibrella sp. WM1]|uniref:hypothetical protein n=1 Tax=Fibrella musci TaxID=3242485 RepID=UPI003521D7E3